MWEGCKQVVLLGQNKGGLNFAALLERVSDVDPEMRIRFTSPHPKDFSFQVNELSVDGDIGRLIWLILRKAAHVGKDAAAVFPLRKKEELCFEPGFFCTFCSVIWPLCMPTIGLLAWDP
uniref:Uncharacterized protein n=1 Tax=Parascaris equorum TaxID=6256 RepID=A0A914S8U5_PAREQ